MFMTLDEALKIMNLTEPYTTDELKKTYRQKVKLYHPDYHPGDKVAEEMMKSVNEANNMLEQYLKDPRKVKDESARNAAYKNKYNTQEEQRKKAEEQRKKAEEQRKKAEEQRKKAEEQRKAEEERLRREVEEQKRKEDAERFERRIQYYDKIELFKLSGILHKDYRASAEIRKNLDDMYSAIHSCYDEYEDYIDEYRYEHRMTGANPFSKENQDRKRKVKNYEDEIRENFKDMKSATNTFFLYYGEYFDYGIVLGKTTNNDLKNYIFADQEQREEIKKQASKKLKEYAEIQKNFLNPVEFSEMREIDPNKRAKSYYNEIALQRDIEAFVKNNYYVNYGRLYTNNNSNRSAFTILRSFNKEYEADSNNLLYGIRYYISNIMNMSLRIYDACPEMEIFNVAHDFKKVADLTNHYDFLNKFYKLVNKKDFDICYKCLLNIDDDSNLHINSLDDLYNTLLMMLNRHNKIDDIRAFNREITLEELTLMDEAEYQKLIKETLNNSNNYNEAVRDNPKMREYQTIFMMYPEMFKGMSYPKAMDFIAAKYEYLKRKNLKKSIIELFKLSEDELEKLVYEESRSKKIDFIMKHNKEYEFKTKTYSSFIDFDKEPEVILRKKSDEELEYIYKQTFMNYVNKNHPEIKITSEQYDKMDDNYREELLEDIKHDIRIRELAVKTRIYLKTPMSYEEVRNLDGKELEELDRKIMLLETENFFTGGGRK